MKWWKKLLAEHIPLEHEPLPLDRALRVYRLHNGKALLVESDEDQKELTLDFEERYGYFPVFDYHKHPALRGDQRMVSLFGTVSDN